MVIPLEGIWDKGVAFDFHIEESTHLGVDESGRNRFDTKRTQMGELVYQLKYKRDRDAAKQIVELLTSLRGIEKINVIVPCPATKNRPWQPVEEIAKELGKKYGIPIINALKKDDSNSQIKDIDDPAERQKLLIESIKLTDDYDFSDKNVLLLDDLYQTGSTLSICTSVLKDQAKAKRVSVLTMTKTKG